MTATSMKKLILKVLSDYEMEMPEDIEECPIRCSRLETRIAALTKRVGALEKTAVEASQPIPKSAAAPKKPATQAPQPTHQPNPLAQCPYCKANVRVKRLNSHKYVCPKRPTEPLSDSQVQAWQDQQHRLQEIGPMLTSKIPSRAAARGNINKAPHGRLLGSFESSS